jgi:hypothetical protein
LHQEAKATQGFAARLAASESPVVAAGLALAAWTGVSGAASGGHPAAMAGLVLMVVAAALAGRRLAPVGPILAPAVVAASPLLALAVRNTSLLGDGAVGYSNASGALHFVAACGAVTAAGLARSTASRVGAFLVAATWILVPWRLGADAAALLALLLPVGVILFGGFEPAAGSANLPTPPGRRFASVARPWLRAGGAAAALAGLLAAIALGAGGYRAAEGGTTVDRLFDRHLGQVRVDLWGDALHLIRQAPLLGVGPGRFEEGLAEVLGRADPRPAHNDYLQVAAEAGLPAGALLLGLVAGGFVLLRARGAPLPTWPAALALGGTALHANIDFIWRFPEVPLALALLVGSAAGLPDAPTGRRAARSGVSALSRPWSSGPHAASAPAERTVILPTLAVWLLLLLPVPGLNPKPTATNGAEWAGAEAGLRFLRPGAAWSSSTPTELYRGLEESGAFTLEVHATAYRADQGGPARILSASAGPRVRNFTLGQEGDALVFRLRTSRTDPNGRPALEVPGVFEEGRRVHLVVATDLEVTRVWVDGRLRWTGPGPGGSLDAWDPGHPLVLGNETTGDRSWLGEIHAVRIHARAFRARDEEGALGGGTRYVAAGEGSVPLVEYRFEPDARGRVPDRAPAGLGPDLHLPLRVPAPSRPLVARLLDPDGEWAARLLAHGLLFLAWVAAVAARSGNRLRPGGVAAAAVALAVAAIPVRNLLDLAPAHWDLIGAGLGTTVALLLLVGAGTARR